MDKVIVDPRDAITDICSGSSIAVGGFGVCGIPEMLIAALVAAGPTDLHIVSNNCGLDGVGLGTLLDAGRISRITASYVGENREFARQYLCGELEVVLTPQGTLAERLRAGGAGIPAFYTATGVGTDVADGGLPWRYGADGAVKLASPARQVSVFNGRSYVLEEAITCDFALVHAAKCDRIGNLVFHAAARNFNPLCAMAGAVAIVEAEQILEVGQIDPDEVHLPGVFVQRVVEVPTYREKPIERLTLRRAGPDLLDGGRR
ncbi:MAG: CoA transferase subunit [Acidimicrobiaceae bacterium]|nr:CoA transferase subunit [Acidimicrobiaceae bacterium]